MKRMFDAIGWRDIIILALPAFLLASCSNGPNKITHRGIAQQCTMNYTDSVKNLVAAGLAHADFSHAGNPSVCDSIYTLQFNTKQEWDSNHKGWLIAAVIVAIIGIGIFIRGTSGGNDDQNQVFIVLGTIFLCALLISGFYFFNDYRDIRKSDYVHYIQTDGNLDNWWKLPAQSY